MKYTFGARIIVEPIRLQRLQNERDSEGFLSFGNQINPLRGMDDEMTIRTVVESPNGMTHEQQQAFVRAMNRMLQRFRNYIAEEFSTIIPEEKG